jgi:hypothetical protein
MNFNAGLIAAASAAMLAMNAAASCGSAFCTINTSWESQGLWSGAGTRVDLRFEYVRQDDLRAGSGKASPSGTVGEDDELTTTNRNWLISVEHSFDEHWGVAVHLPFLSRTHTHIANDPNDGPTPERWDFRRVGDARIIGRYQFGQSDPTDASIGLRFGIKLPTGVHDVSNSDGVVAERSLQPGTGTTDLILGLYVNGQFDDGRSGWFAQAGLQQPLSSRDDFKPGAQLNLDAGYRRELSGSVDGLLQLNVHAKQRDSGAQAEPDLSGGRFVSLSPGLSWAVSRDTRAYGFAQLPVYRYVNGTQLTARWSLVAGISHAF